MWLTARQALTRLSGKPQSLYASVSRGRIRAKPDPADSRRSLYFEADVDRLAARSRGRRSTAAVAVEAINWGEPVLETAISTVAGGRLWYRGKDVATLADRSELEDVAGLLWGGFPPASPPMAGPDEAGLPGATVALARRAMQMRASFGRPVASLREDAAEVFAVMGLILAGPGDAEIQTRLAATWHVPPAADVLRRALVLLADHELNASTFAARVTVSTGASLAAGTLAGLAALSGPRHGGASSAVTILAEDVGGRGPAATDALRQWLGEGRGVPGFGHRLYPEGDIRAAALLKVIDVPSSFAALARAGSELTGEEPNIDFALAAMAAAFKMPAVAPTVVFALGRSVGWLAHMLEQAATGTLIRPRARYVGDEPKSA